MQAKPKRILTPLLADIDAAVCAGDMPKVRALCGRLERESSTTSGEKTAEQLLADPQPGVTLDDIKIDLNGLAKLREGARLAFCKRLAIAFMLIVGHRPTPRIVDPNVAKFYAWCAENIRSGSGKPYAKSSLATSISVGFSTNPEKTLAQYTTPRKDKTLYDQVGRSVRRAIRASSPPNAIPVKQLRRKFNLPSNVAYEVNALMTAWEQASSQARSQFIYMVTGQRVAA